ncbi:hypothetical protein [uncultured Algoriphagus sp.]|uniref:hypothetical protein n=1 Tax=uncultured Algoriphagus sp. TaxID=417365 RepID=UPI002597BD57|nr:hypothetical protein [uncultured Algoriphagus sp.]
MKNYAYLLLLLFGSCQLGEEKLWQPEKIEFPGPAMASLPFLSASEDRLLLSFVSPDSDSTHALYVSEFKDEAFSSPELITRGEDWFVNWADYPAIVENQGNLLAHILKKSSPATFSYDIQMQVRPKSGGTWKNNLALHKDSTLTEHGFVSSIAYSDSSYLVTWLDGRQTSAGGHDHSAHSGAMSLRVAEVNIEGKVIWDELLDARTCDCCQTTATMTAEGPIILYRNRSDREIRDIAITRLVHGKWTEPSIIHPDGWTITGCPVNGPRVDAEGENVLAAWFTDADQSSAVKVAFSSNSGADFSQAQSISTGDALGRVDVTLLNEEEGLISWMEMKEDATYLMVQKVNQSGNLFPAYEIAVMDPSRRSGFPQMERFGDWIYFAWTEMEGPEMKIALARVGVDTF